MANIREKDSKDLTSFASTLVIPYLEKQVLFYSRFESGNLLRAIRKTKVKQLTTFSGIEIRDNAVSLEYDLYLEPDTQTEGHTHWYYFLAYAKSLRKGERVRLNIRNLARHRSLYQDGMLPRICYKNDIDGKGWHVDPAVTQDVKFSTTDQKDNFDKQFYFKQNTFSTLSFIYQVQQDNERVYFAYDRPYTYNSDLRNFMDKIRNARKHQPILQISQLCTSLGGNIVPLLTITNDVDETLSYYEMLRCYSIPNRDVRNQLKNEKETV